MGEGKPMKGKEIELWFYYRPSHAESIEARHAEIADKMRRVGPPLDWAGLDVPPAPDCGADLSAHYSMKYPIKGLWMTGDYTYRSETYEYDDRAYIDDKMTIYFKTSNSNLDYRAILHEYNSQVIEAFRSYRATVGFETYAIKYQNANMETLNRLRQDKTIDVDGRNNIFILEPAMYWDDLLCWRALGYGPEEVIRRLQGQVPLVKPLMDGVYTVFGDDPDLTYEEFTAINDRFKPILGLI
jgi:hypothetical protein